MGDDLTLPVSVHLLYLAAQPAPPSFLYVNQYIKNFVKKEMQTGVPSMVPE
ncbi:unnamed protein product [Heligmosomoides polygyrus]|uniref:Uncharacterized protein n=1 Tax=Heligmosomoides polygyrus TaxID=6339 RepID=A0A3P7TUW8_HELPZ|nr:unnamed protein product [Heligmosomoides polygyrus]